MALFLSPINNDSSATQTPKVFLTVPAHVKMSRIWMFAMLKDRPTPAEREHITVCEPCGRAFRAALGVSSFGKGLRDPQPQVSEAPTRPDEDAPKAVA